MAEVYTLLVEVGRRKGDGLPRVATGAALLCYASGISEAEAVNETVAVLKAAGLAPLDVTGYGTRDERSADGDEIDPEEGALMDRALAENAVIVAQMTPFLPEPDPAARTTAPERAAAPERKSGPERKPRTERKPRPDRKT